MKWMPSKRRIVGNAKRALVAVAVTVAAVPMTSQAAYVCTGKIGQMSVTPGGELNISIAGDGVSLGWQIVCNTRIAFNGIEPAACKTIYASLLTARALDRPVTFWFEYSYQGAPKCTAAAHPEWTALTAADWYFGPTW